MRLLHQWHDHAGGRLPREKQEAERGRHQERTCGKSLPLRYPRPNPTRGQTGRGVGLRREAHMNIQISRRGALIGSGVLIVAFSLGAPVTGALAEGSAKPVTLTDVDSFLAIDKTGKVTVYSGKVDLGTGVYTALQQIVADELDVPMSRIEM